MSIDFVVEMQMTRPQLYVTMLRWTAGRRCHCQHHWRMDVPLQMQQKVWQQRGQRGGMERTLPQTMLSDHSTRYSIMH